MNASGNSTSKSTEQQFKKEFSKRLAEALLDNDEQQRQKSCHTSKFNYTQALEAYTLLCYDDPILQSDQDCALLGETLIRNFTDLHRTQGTFIHNLDNNQRELSRTPTTATLGLSDRFVEGVLQAIRKFDHRVSSNQHQPNNSEGDVDGNVTLTQQHATAESGYVDLAFTIFCEGVRLACREIIQAITADLETSYSEEPFYFTALQSQAFLGSFTGMEQRVDNKEVTSYDSIDYSQDYDHVSVTEQHDDDMIEVFAEESDSDDFDYTHAQNNNALIGDAQVETSSHAVIPQLDPIFLSQPTTYSSPHESSIAILNKLGILIQNISYSIFGSISNPRWKDLKVSQTLSDIALDLLFFYCFETEQQIAITTQGDAIRRTTTNDIEDRIHQLGSSFVFPIQVLRDRCLDQAQHFDCIDDYIRLLRIIVQRKSMDIQSIGYSLLLDICSLFQRNKLLDRVPTTAVSMAFTKKQMILRDTVLSTFYTLLQTIHSLRRDKISSVSSQQMMQNPLAEVDDDPTWTQYVLHQSPLAFLFVDCVNCDLMLLLQQQQTLNDAWDIEIHRYVKGKQKIYHDDKEDKICGDMDRVLAHQAVKYMLKRLDGDQTTRPVPVTISTHISRRNNIVSSKRD